MKKILTVLALCACVAFAGTATETLLEETVFQPDQKNFRFWKVKELTAATTVKDGVVKIEFKADASKKPNLYNAQFIVPYEKGFKAGVKYRGEVTLKSSADLKIAMNVSLNRNPWTSLRGKTIQLKEGVPPWRRSISPPPKNSPATTAFRCSPSAWRSRAARWRSPE